MRKPVTIGLILLLLIGLTTGIWFLLQPTDATESADNRAAPAPIACEGDEPLDTNSALEPGQEPQPGDESVPVKPKKPTPNLRAEASEPTSEPATDAEEPTSATDAPGALIVEGVVRDTHTQQVIAGASVELSFSVSAEPTTLETKTSAEGKFRFEIADLDSLPDGASLLALRSEYEPCVKQAVIGNNDILMLSTITTVIVTLSEGSGIPESTWLTWDTPGVERQLGGDFDPLTRKAVIEISELDRKTPCKAVALWFGTLIESEPIQLKSGKTHHVTLTIPHGARIKVRVTGPDARPMSGVHVLSELRSRQSMYAITDENGDALFTGVPAPSTQSIALEQVKDGVFSIEPKTAELTADGDYVEILFDLTGTGIIDCQLKVGDEHVRYLKYRPAESSDQNRKNSVWLYDQHGDDDEAISRIYGILPGVYIVEADMFMTGQSHEAEMEVLPPPAVTVWDHVFQTYTLTVRVRGADSTEGMELQTISVHGWKEDEFEPNEDGEFEITGLSGDPIRLRIWGAGYSSDVISVDPTEGEIIEVEVVASGIIVFATRGGSGYNLRIHRIEPKGPTFTTSWSESELEVAPGRYLVSEGFSSTAPWEPVEVVVVAGERVECACGPEYTCTLKVRVKDRSALWHFEAVILNDDKVVPHRLVHTTSGADEYYQFYFTAEGDLTIRISGDEIETIEKNFVGKRNETIPLDVVLVNKK